MPIKVLIIDDSPVMRALIRRSLSEDPHIEVVGEAAHAFEARDAIKGLSPDVITLDIEMPKMDGISFLQRLMRRRPIPVIMISSLTNIGADKAIEALSLGAFDCIGKPQTGDPTVAFSHLTDKIKSAYRSKPLISNAAPRPHKVMKAVPRLGQKTDRIIVIGASTGGVEALLSMLAEFPEDCPRTYIVQHMPGKFTASLSRRLNGVCPALVREAKDGDLVKQGEIVVAPGGDQHMILAGLRTPKVEFKPNTEGKANTPSVDVLFESASRFSDRVVGILLTGMGKDGANGLSNIKAEGGVTFAQDKASCVVYGMPRAAVELGIVDHQMKIGKMVQKIIEYCSSETS